LVESALEVVDEWNGQAISDLSPITP
jgi:hypothetical protein